VVLLHGFRADPLGQFGLAEYAMYVQDYGAPAGWRLALADPESHLDPAAGTIRHFLERTLS
jgi:hypothetical protein